MSFSEIERIIGFRLSDSAYTYPAQWSNSESQSFAFGWLNAGYLTRQVNIPEQTVEFVREGMAVPRKETNSPRKGDAMQVGNSACGGSYTLYSYIL